MTEESRGGGARLNPHRLGSFVGELNLLTGQRPFHTARAVADGEILTTARSAQTLALRTFLGRDTIAYRWVNADQADGLDDYLSGVGVTRYDLPVVITPNRVLRRAGPVELGRALGLVRWSEDDRLYDVVVVGAGADRPGRSRVRRVRGPGHRGIRRDSARWASWRQLSDRELPGLSRRDSRCQADHPGRHPGAALRARLTSPSRVEGSRWPSMALPSRSLMAGWSPRAQSWRRPRSVSSPAAGDPGRLEGAGIYYAATYLEAGLSADRPVFVLGGGNSAGQAALFLASRCPHVTIVIRRESRRRRCRST